MQKTYVYFARASTGEIKIGWSSNPEARIKSLNTGSAYPIALIKTIEGTAEKERELHALFDNERLNGEWFRGSRDLMEFISRVHGPTHFDYLCQLEPRLTGLLIEAQLVRDDKKKVSFCANDYWYRGQRMKSDLTCLVGWWAEKECEELKTSEAYNTVYQKVYGALPDCRGCNCIRVQV